VHCPRRDPAAEFLFQFPSAKEFFSGSAVELPVFHFCTDLRAQKVDAKGIAAEELTPALSDKKAGFRDFSLRGQWNIEQEIDQEQDRVIPVLDALKTTASREALSALRTSLQDAFLSHGVVGAGNRFSVVVEKLVNAPVLPESAPVRVIKRFCLV